MSRTVRVKSNETRRYQWLARDFQSLAHYCVVQGGIGAPLCSARPKSKTLSLTTGNKRCTDCARIEQQLRTVRRYERAERVRRFFARLLRFDFFPRKGTA